MEWQSQGAGSPMQRRLYKKGARSNSVFNILSSPTLRIDQLRAGVVHSSNLVENNEDHKKTTEVC